MNNFKIEIANVDCTGCIGLIKLVFEDLEKDIRNFDVFEINFEQNFARASFSSNRNTDEIDSILNDAFKKYLNKYNYKYI